MRFWRKFWLFVIILTFLAILNFYSKEIGSLNLDISDYKLSIGIYAIFIGITFLWMICFLAKSVVSLVISWFSKGKDVKEIESIRTISKLIFSRTEKEFNDILRTENLYDNFEILKTALIVNKKIKTTKYLEKTGFSNIDIFLLKSDLKEAIEKDDFKKAADLADNIIKKYPLFLEFVQEELLIIGKIAAANDLPFVFDPRKFKYNLSTNFADEYCAQIEIIRLEKKEEDSETKNKQLEKLCKKFENSKILFDKYLDSLLVSNDPDSKKIIEFIDKSFNLNPQRNLALKLLKIHRNDIFEIAQEITAKISDNNIEKLWFLLIIATKMNFTAKIKDLILKMIQNKASLYELSLFYIENLDIMKLDSSIINLIKKESENGNKI